MCWFHCEKCQISLRVLMDIELYYLICNKRRPELISLIISTEREAITFRRQPWYREHVLCSTYTNTMQCNFANYSYDGNWLSNSHDMYVCFGNLIRPYHARCLDLIRYYYHRYFLNIGIIFQLSSPECEIYMVLAPLW